MKMDFSEVCRAVDGEEQNKPKMDVVLTGVSFDTRTLKKGDLFVPLTGEHDGHDFIDQARAQGAAAALWNKKRIADAPTDFPIIVVDDTLKALQQLSSYYLHKINPKVVAITGSNGKTTTKDMIASVLATQFNVTKTNANFNNEIGVPVTVLGMGADTEVLVVEMGMDRPGQLDFLSKLVIPDVAVITMIGEAHIEFFGTRDKIADAKMEITRGLSADGCFVYDGDEPLLRQRAQKLDVQQETFGRETEDEIYPTNVTDLDSSTKFKTNLFNEMEFSIPMIGDYNVNNALAALEVGSLFHIKPNLMRQALSHPDLTANRTEWIKGASGEMILSDVYNSNPSAVSAVLGAFGNTHLDGKRIVVLGDMLELGDQSKAMHAGLAGDLNPSQFSQVYLIGTDMKSLDDKIKNKYDDEHLHYYTQDEMDSLIQDLQSVIEPGDEILLKGSHGIHLERVLKALK